eukprot:Mrub_06268.p1 GENE.Mrub_06268~~Mrub_06268.p1  ORF type:complete len:248 (+),score=58.38 Mrub_06268:55-798(+)
MSEQFKSLEEEQKVWHKAILDGKYPEYTMSTMQEGYNKYMEEFEPGEEEPTMLSYDDWYKKQLKMLLEGYKVNGPYSVSKKHEIEKNFDHTLKPLNEYYPSDLYDAIKKDKALDHQKKSWNQKKPLTEEEVKAKQEKLKAYFQSKYKNWFDGEGGEEEEVEPKHFECNKNPEVKYTEIKFKQDGVMYITPEVAKNIFKEDKKDVEAEKGKPYKYYKDRVKKHVGWWMEKAEYPKQKKAAPRGCFVFF